MNKINAVSFKRYADNQFSKIIKYWNYSTETEDPLSICYKNRLVWRTTVDIKRLSPVFMNISIKVYTDYLLTKNRFKVTQIKR